MKQVILGAPHWFLLRGAACGVLEEPVVAVTASVPVPVTGSRYGHLVPITANTGAQRGLDKVAADLDGTSGAGKVSP